MIEKKHVLRFLVIGRMAHLQISKPINVVVHSDSVKIFLENVITIDLSIHNCVVCMQRHDCLDFFLDVIYVLEQTKRKRKDKAQQKQIHLLGI